MKNFGFIPESPTPEDFVFGSETGVVLEPLQTDRDFTQFLAVKEYQKSYNTGFDTFGCVSFSRNNCLETYIKRKFGKEENWSDRFLVVASETIPGIGNTFKKVADTGRKVGAVDEPLWPFVHTSKEYYTTIPQEVFIKALEVFKTYEFKYDWVPSETKDKIWDALQYTPLQVSVHAWDTPVNDVYQKTTKQKNHAVMLFKGVYGQYWWIYDHYFKDVKQLAWDFDFGSIMRHVVIKSTMLDLIKIVDQPDVFALDKKGIRHHIYNEKQFEYGYELGLWGGWDEVKLWTKEKVASFPEGAPIIFGIF